MDELEGVKYLRDEYRDEADEKEQESLDKNDK